MPMFRPEKNTSQLCLVMLHAEQNIFGSHQVTNTEKSGQTQQKVAKAFG